MSMVSLFYGEGIIYLFTTFSSFPEILGTYDRIDWAVIFAYSQMKRISSSLSIYLRPLAVHHVLFGQ